MIVVSTTYQAPIQARERCIASVPKNVRHVYIDAADQPEPLSHFENLIHALADVPSDEIVVSLDGDDWLLPGVVERIQREHDAGALVTYGSYRYADGRPGHCRALRPGEKPRQSPWVTSHPKTFRAGLFRRIDFRHFRGPDGLWLPHARDLALMFPLLEMAGTRAHFIPDVLYVYNYANSTEHNASPEELRYEANLVRYVRGLPEYELCVTS